MNALLNTQKTAIPTLRVAAMQAFAWLDRQSGVKPAVRLALMMVGLVAAMQGLPLIAMLFGGADDAAPAVGALWF